MQVAPSRQLKKPREHFIGGFGGGGVRGGVIVVVSAVISVSEAAVDGCSVNGADVVCSEGGSSVSAAVVDSVAAVVSGRGAMVGTSGAASQLPGLTSMSSMATLPPENDVRAVITTEN